MAVAQGEKIGLESNLSRFLHKIKEESLQLPINSLAMQFYSNSFHWEAFFWTKLAQSAVEISKYNVALSKLP